MFGIGNAFQNKDSYNFLSNMMNKMSLEEEEPEGQSTYTQSAKVNNFHTVELEDEEKSENSVNSN